ncbi:hypothetical protein Hhis01_02056 [Haloarcula hispanica]
MVTNILIEDNAVTNGGQDKTASQTGDANMACLSCGGQMERR